MSDCCKTYAERTDQTTCGVTSWKRDEGPFTLLVRIAPRRSVRDLDPYIMNAAVPGVEPQHAPEGLFSSSCDLHSLRASNL